MIRIAIFLNALCLFASTAWAGSISGTVEAPVAKHKVNTVVFVKIGPKAPAVVPRTAHMDQKGLVFIPRVLPIQKGATVEFLNSDPVAHSVFTIDGEKYDLGTWPQGQTKKYTFSKAGVYRQLCKVHDDMLAFVVVLDTAQFAISDKAGAFKLDGLAPGTYTLGVWHEKLAAPDIQITVPETGNATTVVQLRAK
jgi:plastocyanin